MRRRSVWYAALALCLAASAPAAASAKTTVPKKTVKKVVKKNGWRRDAKGKLYYYVNGSIARNRFVRIKSKNKTCYFNARGKLVKNAWISVNGMKYRADAHGTIRKDCFVQVKGKTYYLRKSGVMQIGWKKFSTGLRYFGEDGVLRRGRQKIGGITYLFSDRGILQTGTQVRGDTTYYLTGRGRMERMVVQTENGDEYYLGDGTKLTDSEVQGMIGLQHVGDSWYYFHTNTLPLKNQWIDYYGERYYAGGVDGALKTGFWTDDAGNTYYFSESTAVMKRGWQYIGSNFYYFDLNTGKMARNTTVDQMTINADGSAVITEKTRPYLETYVTAQQVVEQETTATMTQAEKLRKCFEYVMRKPYITRRFPFQDYDGWEVDYANDTFLRGGGTCYSDASSFAFLANALGYEEVYSASSYGHGWTLINGRVYDPLLVEDKKTDYYYGGFAENENHFIAAIKAKVG